MNDPNYEPDRGHAFFAAMHDQIAAQILVAPPHAGRRRLQLSGRGLRARRVLRPLPLAGMGMGLAAATIAMVIAFGAGGADPAPAYAVTFNNNSVTIAWREWSAIGTLNARLSGLHMRIRVVPIIHGCVAPVHNVIYADSEIPTHIAPGPATTLEVSHVSPRITAGADDGRDQGGELTTWNDTLPGRTRIFAVTKSGGWSGGVFTVVGPAPRCVGDGQ